MHSVGYGRVGHRILARRVVITRGVPSSRAANSEQMDYVAMKNQQTTEEFKADESDSKK